MITIVCKTCHEKFDTYVGRNKRFCSRICLQKGTRGRNHPMWKGNKVGYKAIHNWLHTRFGSANRCENIRCSKKSKSFQWAKLRKKRYERKRRNYWMLCYSCHKKYDIGYIL